MRFCAAGVFEATGFQTELEYKSVFGIVFHSCPVRNSVASVLLCLFGGE